MIKVLAVFDGLRFSEATLQHSVQIAKSQPAHLVGLFLEDFTYQSFSRYKAITRENLTTKQIAVLEKKDEATRKASRERFMAVCKKAGIEHSIHKENDVAFPTLMQEAIYADLVVIDANETFSLSKEKAPTEFIRDFLSGSESPVLLVNKKYTPVTNAVMLFDGEPSSVFAIKQYSYLIGAHQDLNVEVLTVKKEKSTSHVPDNRLMKEFMKRHFPKAVYTVVKGDYAEPKIIEHLKQLPGKPLIVLGAYRRGMVSRWFKQSMADTLLEHLTFPLFIAHNKA
ncbi:MAG TPA: universal stress protein [Ferruginibacter sp.]|nr:universal stress protein [Ferruginibacter sp.]HRO17552.1 universal stress protein [Ferruginibacter sp.]HRQ20699.1 universal stress protein [Ferruginibacter sp.]